jgi:hypothetical protein
MKNSLNLFVLLFMAVALFAAQPYGTLEGSKVSKPKGVAGAFKDMNGNTIGACTVTSIILDVATANDGFVLYDGYGSDNYIIFDPKNSSAVLPQVFNLGRNGVKFTREPYISSITGVGDGVMVNIIYN